MTQHVVADPLSLQAVQFCQFCSIADCGKGEGMTRGGRRADWGLVVDQRCRSLKEEEKEEFQFCLPWAAEAWWAVFLWLLLDLAGECWRLPVCAFVVSKGALPEVLQICLSVVLSPWNKLYWRNGNDCHSFTALVTELDFLYFWNINWLAHSNKKKKSPCPACVCKDWM